MPDTLAATVELAAHLQRDLNEADAFSAGQALTAASDLIRAYTRLPDLAPPVAGDVKGVCLDVATRRMANPEGLRNRTVGPYTDSPETVGLALTAGEKAVLDARFGGRPSVYSVELDLA